MRKHLRGPTAALTIPVLVALMLVVGRPQRADASIVYYGTSESSATFLYGGSIHYTFHWRFSVGFDTSNHNAARYRAHLWCTREGSPTKCNFRNDDAYLFYKDCPPSLCDPTGAYGPRDFPGCPDYCGITDAYYNGSSHIDSHVSFRSYSGAMQARFLAIDHLTNQYWGCSKWAMSNGEASDPGHCP
jgi:hypothetical protein